MIQSIHISVDGIECHEVYNDDIEFEVEMDGKTYETTYIITFPGSDGRRWEVRYVRYDEAAHAAALGVSPSR